MEQGAKRKTGKKEGGLVNRIEKIEISRQEMGAGCKVQDAGLKARRGNRKAQKYREAI